MVGTSSSDSINGEAGDDFISGDQGNDSIDGGNGSDHIQGGEGSDSISGGAGDDFISGDQGNDTLIGGAGSDHIQGGDGADLIIGGIGSSDTIGAGLEGDFLFGDAGDDNVYGSAGSDHMQGGEGSDSISGGLGDDFISGDRGNDTLEGGDGNDTYIVKEGLTGNDIITDSSGNDEIDFVSVEYGINGDFDTNVSRSGTDLVVSFYQLGTLKGSVTIQGQFPNTSSNPVIETFRDVKKNQSFVFNNTFAGTTINDFMVGTSSSDSINGEAGDDIIFGDQGNDSINGGDGSDHIQGGVGSDSINGGSGDDFISGDQGNDSIDGGDGSDHIQGGEGSDSISGGSGDDFIIGGQGSDSINGGDGNDIYQFALGDSNIGNIDTLIGDFSVGTADKIKLIGTSGTIEVLSQQSIFSLSDINPSNTTLFSSGLGNIYVRPIITSDNNKKYLAIDFNQSGQFDQNDLLIDVTNSTFSTVTGGLTADSITAIRDVATFNGGGYLTTNIHPFTNVSSFTLSFWVNPSTLNGNQDLVGQNDQLEVFISSDNSLQIWMPSIGTIKVDGISTKLKLNQWSNIVIAGNGSQEEVYINNQKVGNSTYRGTSTIYQQYSSMVDTFRVGNYVATNNTTHPLAGAIDDIAIWNSALSTSDISNLKNGNNPKTIDSTHLSHYWDFENGSLLDTGSLASQDSNFSTTGTIALVGVTY
jgi:Ca2+-binding RTX toxin-like protein